MNKYFIILFLLFATAYSQPQKNFYIQKNNQGGFNIYDDSGELVQEFTNDKIDSNTLSTMNEIFTKANSQISDRQPIVVLNLGDNGFEWSNVIIALVALGGTIIGLWWGSKSQIKQSKLNSQIEEKKEWINDLRLDTAEFVERWADYDFANEELNKLVQKGDLITEVEKFKFEAYKNFNRLISSKLKVDCLLNPDLGNHLELKIKLNELMMARIKAKNNEKDLQNLAKTVGDIIREIIERVNELIKEEKDKLKKIEKEIK